LKSFQKFGSYMWLKNTKRSYSLIDTLLHIFVLNFLQKVGENRHLSRLVKFNKMKFKKTDLNLKVNLSL